MTHCDENRGVKLCAQCKQGRRRATYDAGDDDAVFQGTDDTRETVTVGTAAAKSLTAAFGKEATVSKEASADEDGDPEESSFRARFGL